MALTKASFKSAKETKRQGCVHSSIVWDISQSVTIGGDTGNPDIGHCLDCEKIVYAKDKNSEVKVLVL